MSDAKISVPRPVLNIEPIRLTQRGFNAPTCFGMIALMTSYRYESYDLDGISIISNIMLSYQGDFDWAI